MNVTIEKALPCDAADLLEYLKQIGGETDNLTFGAEGVPFSTHEEMLYIEKMEQSENGILLLAKENGKIIGNASLNRFPRRMCHRGEMGVSVLKDYWNKGIGGRLLNQIIDYAKENNYTIIDLQVRSDNYNAIHLYEKFGFKKIGTHPKFHKVDNSFLSFDYMYLDL